MALRLISTIGNDNRVDVAPTGAALGEHSNRRNTILPAMLWKVRARSRAMVAKRCACLDAAHRYEWAIDHRVSGMMLNDYYKGGPPDRILARPPAEIKRMGGHASQFGSLAPGACAVRAGRWSLSRNTACFRGALIGPADILHLAERKVGRPPRAPPPSRIMITESPIVISVGPSAGISRRARKTSAGIRKHSA
jgi:hypothetical protein